ncbi:MAG TPA: hypothetical protein DGG94_16190 [Micromonosporaceae bacterium]|nr:hypothetical protein [Micromonosporaceae bacterium]HCU51310.1 hypothetical protein [Micromonosporaceae bacterium]
MSTLEEFVTAACAELGVPEAEVDTALLLELAREVAHNTVRPAAPVSTYLLGLAVGRGGNPSELAARLTALAHA